MKLHANVKLGKRVRRSDARTLRLSQYTAAMRQAPLTSPDVFSISSRMTALGQMLNDRIGDCTCAAVGHIIQGWTAYRGKQVTLTDDQIEKLYSTVSDYDPMRPSTDNGAVMLDVLRYWNKNGVEGHLLNAYAEAVNAQDVRNSVYYFGACYIGLALPLSAEDQEVWKVPVYGTHFSGVPGTWGGHCVCVVDYNPTGPVCITWGALKQMTWSFYEAYCDEAYALLSPDWALTESLASGFDLASLNNDLKRIGVSA